MHRVDPLNPERFSVDGFYIMNSMDSFVVQPLTSNHLDIHLLVTEDCPKTNAELDFVCASTKHDRKNYFNDK